MQSEMEKIRQLIQEILRITPVYYGNWNNKDIKAVIVNLKSEKKEQVKMENTQKEKSTQNNSIKRLKIRFVKFKKALSMQILEQEGLPKEKNKGFVTIKTIPFICKEGIHLRGCEPLYNDCIESIVFASNQERDEYLEKCINNITEELFPNKELKPVTGDDVWVRRSYQDKWEKRRFIIELPDTYYGDKSDIYGRYVCETPGDTDRFVGWKYMKPLNKTRPTITYEIDNDIVREVLWESED